jgi:hypothetical protein
MKDNLVSTARLEEDLEPFKTQQLISTTVEGTHISGQSRGLSLPVQILFCLLSFK